MPPRKRPAASQDPEDALLDARLEEMARALRLRQERAASAAQRQAEEALPYLSEMDAPSLDAFLARLVAQLRGWPRFPQIEALLAPERLVRDVVDALARNTRGAAGRTETTFNVQARHASARRAGVQHQPL